MSGAITCPNPRCSNPTNVQTIVFSGTSRTSPDSPRAKKRRRSVNRGLMQPRTMFATWGLAGGLSGLLIVVGLYLFAVAPTGQNGKSWDIAAIAAWVVAVALMIWSRWMLVHPRSRPTSDPDTARWSEVYFCGGCGNVFEPVSRRYVPLDQASKLFA